MALGGTVWAAMQEFSPYTAWLAGSAAPARAFLDYANARGGAGAAIEGRYRTAGRGTAELRLGWQEAVSAPDTPLVGASARGSLQWQAGSGGSVRLGVGARWSPALGRVVPQVVAGAVRRFGQGTLSLDLVGDITPASVFQGSTAHVPVAVAAALSTKLG
ncbi:MAG: hypothetical protein AB1609_15830, partial [Bacillota bacterium]